MKKALVYLAFSILILGMIISYDVTKCDGQVIMRHFIHSDYEPSYEVPSVEDSQVEYVDVKPVITKPVSIDLEEEVVSEEVEVDEDELEEIEEELPEEEEEVIDDYSRGYEYYFGQLSDKEKAVYRVMYKAFSDVSSGNTIPTIDDEAMNRVASYIKLDHPEFFYIDSMGYTHYTLGGQIQKTVLAVTYTDSKTVIGMEKENIEQAARQVINSIPASADDYTKVKAVYDWVITSTDYNLQSRDNQNIKSVFLNGSSVCAGYARATQYLLNQLGIPTTMVEGNSLVTGENHAWNLCYADGNYYYVDTTWGDASYVGNDYEDTGVAADINYDYLLVTTEELNRTHVVSPNLKMPLCASMDDNYYVREGLYFTTADPGQLSAVFSNAYAQGKKTISFKCANLEIYDSFRNYLIRQNGIFDYLQGNTNAISYVENEEQRTLCFWL